MINTRDRRITHNVAKISVDQILDPIAGVYFNIKCDLNLLTPPAPYYCYYYFFFPRFPLLKRPTYYRNPPE